MAEFRFPRWAPPVTLTLAVLGLADSAYLTYVHFTSVANLRCVAGGIVDCAAVTTSPESEIFGHIPVSVTGLCFYVVVVALMTPWAWRAPRLKWPRVAVMAAGMGMVFYLLYAELVQIGKLCEYCTGVHVITFLLLVATLAATLLRPLPTVEEVLAEQDAKAAARKSRAAQA